MASESDIIQRESGGDPYVGYTPPGKPKVNLRNAPLDQFGFPIWSGNMGPAGISHAAGLYQFEPKTWREGASALGVKDFSPASQKAVYDWTHAKYGDAPWAASAPSSKYDPESGRDVPYVLVPPAREEMQLPPMLLDRLLGRGGSAAGEGESATGEPNPLAFLNMLMGPQQGQQAPEEQPGAATQQAADQLNVPMAPFAPPTVDMNISSTQEQTFRPVGQEAMPEQAAAPAANPASLLDRLLGAVNPIGSAQAAEREPPMAPQPNQGASLLDRLLGIGDPEATGAAAASTAMEPVVGGYLRDVASGKIASEALPSTYDPQKSFAANVRAPSGLEQAMGVALSFTGGAGGGGKAPPVAPGHVRFYHGADQGVSATSGGGRWVTPDPEYARNFRSAGIPKAVWYVDLPKGHPTEVAARAWDQIDEMGQTNMVGRYRHVEVPEDVARGFKIYDGGRKPPGGGDGPPKEPPPVGREPPAPPPGGGVPPRPPGRVSAAVTKAREWAERATRDAQIKVVPMAAGEDAGRAIAKDYANMERLARYRRSIWDKELRGLSPEDQKAMWEAMDNASVAAQQTGNYDAGLKWLKTLPKDQQRLVQEMENHGIELWQQAQDAGLVAADARRLPFYVMRGIVEVAEDGQISRVRSGGGPGTGMSNLDQFGVNLTDRGVRSRDYLTVEQTEAAAQKRFGEGATAVRNIRVLPMAYERFERAIAGRRMINDLKEIGEATGKPAVVEGTGPPGYFTVDHPMFKTYRPRFTTDAAGKTGPVLGENGRPIIDRVPLYIDQRFEGPLRAIARSEAGPLYSAAMQLKSASMATIMNSPAIHNLVEWGRALGSMPGKVATFKIYGIGARTIADKPAMERAIRNGLVPIGERGYLTDIEGIASASDLQPGRGLLAKGAGALTDIVSPKAGEAVRRGIDKAGDFWHQKLLWDQVAKLQAGLYSEFEKQLLKKGIEPESASKMAGHFANRFAGAVPNEAMSEMARKSLNFILFSRSFTTGNLGVMKDMLGGLPRDVRSQIGRDLGPLEMRAARSMAMRRAISTVMVDVAIAYVTNAALQSGISMMRNALDPEARNTPDEEAKGYADRLARLLGQAKENPLSVINPLADLAALSPTADNEPGKQDRILVGHADDGTAIYLRSPVGKIGEEFAGWVTQPLQMLRNKEGTVARPIMNTLNNDRGFGQKVYNANPHGIGDVASNIGRVAWEFFRSQTPESQFRAGYKLLTGQGDKVDVAQFASPFFGGTISRGAPGGEAVGELYAARSQHEQQVKEALPEVKRLVQSGKQDEAEQMLDSLGMPPKLRNYYIRVYNDPSARLSRGAMRQFERSATPEQKARMQHDLSPHNVSPPPGPR